MNSTVILVLVIVVLVILAIFLITQLFKKNKIIKKKDIDILREKVLKNEVLELMKTDKAVEEKVSAKVNYIQNCSDDELISIGNGMYNRNSRTGK